MSASTQLARLLALVPYLLNHDEARVEDVARDFDISSTQLRKDLELLTWCSLPGQSYGSYIEIDMDAVDGQGVIRLDNADYLSRPLRFTADEAVALLLALRSLREVADPEQCATIDATIDKLSGVATEGAAAAADRTEVRISGGDEAVRRAVHRALREQRRLQLTYDAAAKAETTERQVDPLRASVRDGYAYLDAWCHRAKGLRSFRMDRIVDAEVIDLPVDAHPDVTLPDPAESWFSVAAAADRVVTLDLAPAAHWVVEYHPTLTADSSEDPNAARTDETAAESDTNAELRRARFRVGDPAWLRGLLLRLGPDVSVVEPVGADESAREEARTAVEQYRALGLLDAPVTTSG